MTYDTKYETYELKAIGDKHETNKLKVTDEM